MSFITLYYLSLIDALARESALKAYAKLTHGLHFNWASVFKSDYLASAPTRDKQYKVMELM
jgi:hypothetical protein